MNPRYEVLRTEPGLWTVGYHDQNGRWEPVADKESKLDAQNLAWEMNGSRPE